MRTGLKYILVTLSTTIAITMIIGPASALNSDFYYPGESCFDVWSTGRGTYSSGMIGNANTTYGFDVDCPAVHADGNNYVTGYLYYVDRNYGDNFSCTINNCIYSGTSITCRSSSKNGGDYADAYLHVISFDEINSWGYGHTFISCIIPHKYSGNTSWIVNYNIYDIYY
jgi:hypothetical protein